VVTLIASFYTFYFPPESLDKALIGQAFKDRISHSFLAGGIFETNFYDSEVVMMTYYLMALPFISLRDRI